MLELTLRLVFSLAVVLGLLMLMARLGARRFKGGADALVRVVHRQPLSRGSAVAVVTVGSRVLVLGTTEQQVSVLTELDPEELVGDLLEHPEAGVGGSGDATPAPADDAGTLTAPVPVRSAVPTGSLTGSLTGSVLSRHTWKQALAALSGSARRP